MASAASYARDIPKAFGRDSLIAVAPRSVPTTKAQHSLPTPPNSISPNLPPHVSKQFGTRSPLPQLHLEHVDSDLDLQDGSGNEGVSELGSPGLDTTGAITPGLLAKHHLPEILLDHGPLAIRHIMGYLTTSVPGFSGIPPAKARRLVVGALEGRGNGGEAGGVKGNVLFEKVGWGRWDARLKGHPARQNRDFGASPSPSLPDSYPVGMPIANNHGWSFTRTRLDAPGSSWAGDSAAFSHRDDISMAENEADKMSLDGDDSESSSEVGEDAVMEDDPNDVTDEEDWAAVGAAALRAASYSASGPHSQFLHSNVHRGVLQRNLGSSLSVPPRTHTPIDFTALGLTSTDSQEREAIEALLRLGSV
ncbi:DNA-binding proteins Bright/BRCAA1/RBP1 and proteins containing BRIGHT domain [Clarireedia jacksonii]